MNERHQEDELAELQSAAAQQPDDQERDDTPQPESTLPARRSAEEVSTTDATDQLAEIIAKPQVWGTLLLTMILVAVVWAYIDNTSNGVRIITACASGTNLCFHVQ